MANGVINTVSGGSVVGSGLGDGRCGRWEGKVLTAALINVICPLTNYNY